MDANLTELHTLETIQDVSNINSSIATLQNLINQNSSDITAIKSTDVTFTNEFITVSQELQDLATQHSSDYIYNKYLIINYIYNVFLKSGRYC